MQLDIRRLVSVLILFIFFSLSYELTALGSESESSQRATAKSERKQPPSGTAESVTPPLGENAYCDKGNVAHFGDKDGPAELPKTCYYTGMDGTPSI
jgi:hypothetical protein